MIKFKTLLLIFIPVIILILLAIYEHETSTWRLGRHIQHQHWSFIKNLSEAGRESN